MAPVLPSQWDAPVALLGDVQGARSGSRDLATSAILDGFHQIIDLDEAVTGDDSSHDPSLDQGTFLFATPVIDDIPSIDIFYRCVVGTCTCMHLIGDFPCQLKPCRAAQFIFGSAALPSLSDDDKLFLWRGLVLGFYIVDVDCPSTYLCENYDSITEPLTHQEMTTLLLSELDCHKVVVSDSQPRCVHSLGAVRKANGKLRPITDCSRPDANCINNYMETTFSSFSYNSVDSAVEVLNRG